ncbi:hypothetical protein RxyAA322_06020 [Rubrobacter xylanophilus]|uniref:Uncharacterized protein n=1 Tax=Rubrobacter xylanophilus TaxID=49319 RepID=A0A510HFM3_9ACTN|nr:S8 family serine peptidase [Rubrobacter xylanophilus]BBL78748.1 hypothetical protein RxyAA322_06020 [Rubrobacter xylanophilus]
MLCGILLSAILAALLSGGRESAARPEVRPTFATQKAERFARDRIVVGLKKGAPESALRALNRRNGAAVEERIPGTRVRVIDLPPNLSVEAALRRYRGSPDVEYAEPDFLLHPSREPDDPDYPKLYGLKNTGQTGGTPGADIDAPGAWDVTTGSETVVAVVDTGVDVSHPDLEANLWTNDDEVPKDGRDNDGNGYVDDVHGYDFFNDDASVYDPDDGDDHGTHVAGTIAAEGNNGSGIAGVNWRARLMVLKFIGDGYGYTSDAAAAIHYAIDNGAAVINASWGGAGYSQTLKDAVDRAESAGVLVVAAAGNGGSDGVGDDNDTTPFYPSSYDNANVISVAATDDADLLASFSNYGSRSVDLGAPGVGILSTVPGGYASYSGTSMATPHVTGVAALIKGKDPTMNAGQIRETILGAVDEIPALKGKSVTGGRLDAARALGAQNREPASTELSLSARPRILTFGRRTTLSGRLVAANGDPLPGRTVVLQRRPVGAGAFRGFARLTTAADGTYRLSDVRPAKHTRYRARFPGDGGKNFESSTSPVRWVKVRVRVTLRVKTGPLQLGSSRTVRGAVRPRHGGRVTVTIKRNGEVLVRRRISLNEKSRYSFRYRPRRPGTYAISASYPKHRDHLGGRSPWKKFRVTR